MPKYKVFISSVQSEFSKERQLVFESEVMYQMGYIEKYGTGITENIRRMQEARLLAPEIDLSAEFVTTIWRDNDATNIGTNIGTSGNNIATDLLAENKRIVDRIV